MLRQLNVPVTVSKHSVSKSTGPLAIRCSVQGSCRMPLLRNVVYQNVRSSTGSMVPVSCPVPESELLIDAKTQKAVVVDRGALDREMAERAADAGAEFSLKTAAYDVQGTTLLTRGVNGHQEIPFRLLIAADGPRSSIARIFTMPRARTYLAGIQADLVHECDSRFVEIYPDASPDFFGWMIPIR